MPSINIQMITSFKRETEEVNNVSPSISPPKDISISVLKLIKYREHLIILFITSIGGVLIKRNK